MVQTRKVFYYKAVLRTFGRGITFDRMTSSARMTLWACVCCVFAGVLTVAGSECTVDITTDMDPAHPPLVLSHDSHKILYADPQEPKFLKFVAEQPVLLYCPHTTHTNSFTVSGQSSVTAGDSKLKPLETAYCVDKDEFRVGDVQVKFNQIRCEKKAQQGAIMRETNQLCNNGQKYEIGFDLRKVQSVKSSFLKTIDLCHNVDEARTLWAHATIVAGNQKQCRYKRPNSGSRPSFKTGNLYHGVKIRSLYSKEGQLHSLRGLIHSDADTYISREQKSTDYLAIGHLIANVDKVYKQEQDSTFFFANAVPMWQKINAPGGSWYFVEDEVRRLACSKGHDLDVWAGGLGVLELDDCPFWLHYNKMMMPPKMTVSKEVVRKNATSGENDDEEAVITDGDNKNKNNNVVSENNAATNSYDGVKDNNTDENNNANVSNGNGDEDLDENNNRKNKVNEANNDNDYGKNVTVNSGDTAADENNNKNPLIEEAEDDYGDYRDNDSNIETLDNYSEPDDDTPDDDYDYDVGSNPENNEDDSKEGDAVATLPSLDEFDESLNDTLINKWIKMVINKPLSFKKCPTVKHPKDNMLPVPKFLFKCVVDRQNHDGICYVVVNDPKLSFYNQNEAQVAGYHICRPSRACPQTTQKVGYMYCCTLADFYYATQNEIAFEEIRGFQGYSTMTLN